MYQNHHTAMSCCFCASKCTVGSKYMMGHGPRTLKDAQGFCADQQWCCKMVEHVENFPHRATLLKSCNVLLEAQLHTDSYRNSWHWEGCSCPRPLHSMDFHNCRNCPYEFRYLDFWKHFKGVCCFDELNLSKISLYDSPYMVLLPGHIYLIISFYFI